MVALGRLAMLVIWIWLWVVISLVRRIMVWLLRITWVVSVVPWLLRIVLPLVSWVSCVTWWTISVRMLWVTLMMGRWMSMLWLVVLRVAVISILLWLLIVILVVWSVTSIILFLWIIILVSSVTLTITLLWAVTLMILESWSCLNLVHLWWNMSLGSVVLSIIRIHSLEIGLIHILHHHGHCWHHVHTESGKLRGWTFSSFIIGILVIHFDPHVHSHLHGEINLEILIKLWSSHVWQHVEELSFLRIFSSERLAEQFESFDVKIMSIVQQFLGIILIEIFQKTVLSSRMRNKLVLNQFHVLDLS